MALQDVLAIYSKHAVAIYLYVSRTVRSIYFVHNTSVLKSHYHFSSICIYYVRPRGTVISRQKQTYVVLVLKVVYFPWPAGVWGDLSLLLLTEFTISIWTVIYEGGWCVLKAAEFYFGAVWAPLSCEIKSKTLSLICSKTCTSFSFGKMQCVSDFLNYVKC